MTVAKEDLDLLGSWSAAAANELDTIVDATVYRSDGVIAPVAPVAPVEIVELRWVDPNATTELDWTFHSRRCSLNSCFPT
ncbi:hypothetical protein [Cryobacterium aureum]|uniref:hypothetical protein n=1 Tax=Cryobacterium aureum TaxID=995037 RepID=UPI000CF47B5D|nr:hypothetical protein [Cryobacterium aureum]